MFISASSSLAISLPQVVLAAVEGCQGRARISPYTVQAALLDIYTTKRLFPQGIVAEIPAVQDWSLKNGIALARLVPSMILFYNILHMFMSSLLHWKPN